MAYNFLEDLKRQYSEESQSLLNDNNNFVTEDKYEDRPLAECFYAMEAIDRKDEANISLEEGIRGILCFDNDMIVAKGNTLPENFSIESIKEEKIAQYAEVIQYEGVENKFSLEASAITNKIKRGAYAVKINAKEIIQKFLTWIKGVWDEYMVQDGKLKSYKKLLKTYREKLVTTNSSSNGEKEIKIRNTDYTKIVRDYIESLPSSSNSNDVTAIKSAKTLEELCTALGMAAANLTSASKVVKESTTSHVERLIEDALGASSDRTDLSNLVQRVIDGMQDLIKEKSLVEDLDDYIKDNSDDTTEDLKIPDAQSRLISQATAVERLIQDRKYKKMFDNVVKAANSTLNKINKNATPNESTVPVSQFISTIGQLLTHFKKSVVGKHTKFVSSQLQALLADMAKVVNANTKIIEKN